MAMERLALSIAKSYSGSATRNLIHSWSGKVLDIYNGSYTLRLFKLSQNAIRIKSRMIAKRMRSSVLKNIAFALEGSVIIKAFKIKV